MLVFKFGGASIKNAEAIKNMASIIKKYSDERLLVVVSAMGKTTNALEDLLDKSRKGESTIDALNHLKEYHLNIVSELFGLKNTPTEQLNGIFSDLEKALVSESSYDEHYDQVVSKGELLSSTIVEQYLSSTGINTTWADSRNYICTDDNFRSAYVNWEESLIEINKLNRILDQGIILTQGFIGKAENGKTTTLGREGSDFSAAVFATCLNADSVTVWKDVPGILNADPKLVADAQLFNQLPYKEAAEMTYYGASVIHPKTIKPLANKNIPLYVRSFDHPDEPGTIIHECELEAILPTTIIKTDQCLVSFKVIDFSFINEENLSLIFGELAKLDIKINIMQNSAISFSIVIDYRPDKVEALLGHMKDHFEIRYNTGLVLATVKNYQQNQIDEYRKGKKLLLEQISRNNYRALIGS
ncbi:aspartate kinase [Fulvivirga lutimaris]|uniref:aspartate kinase n=1 Tax=Fulvivirga lutimaris TaxID=1819566 RepID=UPI0012BB819C|nr:aspartate kinase [Fulvivirga lutimaris]MTI38151.1 aspartate kinase [Fulvivirga lutimaris]